MFEPRSVSTAQTASIDQGLRAHFLKIYNYMASALILTGLVAYFAGNSEAFKSLMFNEAGGRSGLAYIVMFAPLAMVLFLSFRLNALSESAVKASFWAYSFLMGLSLFYVFIAFTGESIARVFFITAATFGSMSLYGYTTKKDLSGFGSFLMMGLIGVIIASIINIWMQSSAVQFATSILAILIFVGLTAYDTQKIKSMYYYGGDFGRSDKMAIMGALTLYMDFINIFLQLLQLFGERE
jgi:FtsH-binding integral membrane protein